MKRIVLAVVLVCLMSGVASATDNDPDVIGITESWYNYYKSESNDKSDFAMAYFVGMSDTFNGIDLTDRKDLTYEAELDMFVTFIESNKFLMDSPITTSYLLLFKHNKMIRKGSEPIELIYEVQGK
ncbi:MAG: hypothetical protein OCC46_00950 [Pseudodesulfovibrio sp.]